jgi:hypothetical protein
MRALLFMPFPLHEISSFFNRRHELNQLTFMPPVNLETAFKKPQKSQKQI